MELLNQTGRLDQDLILLGLPDVPIYLLDIGGEWALIDAGVSIDRELVWSELVNWVGDVSKVKYWLITHHHYDHCGLLSYLCPKLLNIEVVISDYTHSAWQREKVQSLIMSLNASIGFSETSLPFQSLDSLNCRIVSENDELQLSESCTIKVFSTPGHAKGHLAFYHIEKKRLFIGDALGEYDYRSGSWNPLMFDDVSEYLDSLTKVSSLPLDQIALGHGGVLVSERMERAVDKARQDARVFIDKAMQELRQNTDIRDFSKQLTQEWSTLSERFVPHELHLNSMKFMLKAVENYHTQNKGRKHV